MLDPIPNHLQLLSLKCGVLKRIKGELSTPWSLERTREMEERVAGMGLEVLYIVSTKITTISIGDSNVYAPK